MSHALNPNDPPPAGSRRLDAPRFAALWDAPRPGACPCCDASRLGPTQPRRARASTTSAKITARPRRKVLPPVGRVAAGRVATWGLLASQDHVAFLVGGAS